MSTCVDQAREEVSNAHQARVGTKPDLVDDLPDLRFCLGARRDIFHLTREAEKTDLEYQSQFTPWDQIGKSGAVVSTSSGYLAKQMGRLSS